jgi:predicted ATPase
MLTRFTVKGFKSLLDATVELGAVNVFIGANGSGKSNILEALGVMGAAAFGSVEPETLRYRGVRLGLPALYKTSFREVALRQSLSFEAETNNATYRLELDNPINEPLAKWRFVRESVVSRSHLFFERDGKSLRLLTSVADGALGPPAPFDEQKSAAALFADVLTLMVGSGVPEPRSPALKDYAALITALKDYALFAPVTPVLRGTAEDVAREPLGLGGSGLPTAIQSLLNEEDRTLGPFDLDEVWEMIEWAQDVSAAPGSEVPLSPAIPTKPTVLKFVDRFMAQERNTLSAYDASEGALYVLFMLVLASHPKAPRIFAVDNFDQALHPRLAAALTRMVTSQIVREGKRQMLVTTHNPLVLDGLDLRDDRIRLFAVERARNGATEINRVTLSEELLAEADKGMSLSRLWVMGRLGGVPRSI